MGILKTGLLGGVLVGALVLAACGDNDDKAGDDGVREVKVQALAELRFDPDELTVTAGDSVRLVFENVDGTLHDITFPDMPATDVHVEGGAEHEMDDGEAADGHEDSGEADDGHDEDGAEAEVLVHVAAEAGQTATVTFTPTEAGEYEFHCTVGGHAEAGMVGTIIVEA